MGEVYELEYRVDSASAVTAIANLEKAVTGLATQAGPSKQALGALSQGIADAAVAKFAAALNTAAGNAGKLGSAIDELAKRRDVFVNLGLGVEVLNDCLILTRQSLAGTTADIQKLGKTDKGLDALKSNLWGINNAAVAGEGNAVKLGEAIHGLSSTGPALQNLRADVQGVQRSAYGAKMNVKELGEAIGKIGGGAPALNAVAGATAKVQSGAVAAAAGMKQAAAAADAVGKKAADINACYTAFDKLKRAGAGVSGALKRADGRAQGFGRSMMGLTASLAILQGIKAAVEGAGGAFKDARQAVDEHAAKNISVRDKYREVANLQGKAEPDNEVVAAGYRLRIAAGLTDDEAVKAMQKFEGGLPAGRDKGHIAGNASSGVAGDLLRESLRTATRTKMAPETAADVATMIAQFGKVPTADVGLSQLGAMIDLWNKGRGDLTPLANSAAKNMGNLVGPNAPFRSPAEFVAAQSVASLNATAASSGTRIQQAARELYGFDKTQGPTLKAYGLSPDDTFDANLKKLAPLVTGDDQKPLIEALGKAAGPALVGEHAPIRSAPEYAAFVKNAGEGGPDSVKAAVEGLFDAARKKPRKGGENPLLKAGIDPNATLETNLSKLKPLYEQAIAGGSSPETALADLGIGSETGRTAIAGLLGSADLAGDLAKARAGDLQSPFKNPEARLVAAGFRNSQGRGSIAQLLANRPLLDKNMADARAGADPSKVRALNEAFMAGDDANGRVGKAENDASKFVQGLQREKLAVAREGAEARLRNAGAIDDPAKGFDDFMADWAPTRMLGGVMNFMAGKATPADALPLMLGGKPARELRIDAEARRLARVNARGVAVPGLAADATQDERFNAQAGAVQAAGGNPFAAPKGGDPDAPAPKTDLLLQQILQETRIGNQQREKQQQGRFLPAGPARPAERDL